MSYPATREPTALVRANVLLEMGVRGGQHVFLGAAVLITLLLVLWALNP